MGVLVLCGVLWFCFALFCVFVCFFFLVVWLVFCVLLLFWFFFKHEVCEVERHFPAWETAWWKSSFANVETLPFVTEYPVVKVLLMLPYLLITFP